MSLCQPLHEYFEKIECDPQEVMRILGDDFLGEYVSDPASKKAEVEFLKQQMPLLQEELNSDELLKVYAKVVNDIFTAWIKKYFPYLRLDWFLGEKKIEVAKKTLSVKLSAKSMKGIILTDSKGNNELAGALIQDTSLDQEEVTFPRCLPYFDLTILHQDSRSINAPETISLKIMDSRSSHVTLPKLAFCSTLIVKYAKTLTIGAASIVQLALSDIENLTVIPNKHSQKLVVEELSISAAAKLRLEKTGQLSQIEAHTITITNWGAD